MLASLQMWSLTRGIKARSPYRLRRTLACSHCVRPMCFGAQFAYMVSGKSSVGEPVTIEIGASVREKPPINKITPNPSMTSYGNM
jgi:hypothetical protein